MRLFMLVALLAAPVPATATATARAGIQAWQDGDPGKAVAIWRTLADKGDLDAAFNLGQAHRLGRGVPADSGEARKWFERAARAGHVDAQVSLGLLLFDIGDRANALIWLKRAADRGEPRALLVIGTALFNGDGMKRDPVLGYAYVSRAAAQGLAPAKATLADMDTMMPLAERRKGVALALAAAKPPMPKAAAAKPPAAKPAPAKPAPVKVAQARPAAPTAAPAKPQPPVAAKKVAASLPAPSGGGWRIQLGAFGTRGAAQSLFARLGPSLGGAQAYYIPAGAMTRLQAGPYASRAAASSACARLKPQPCFAVAAK